jgi:hypothetical protein
LNKEQLNVLKSDCEAWLESLESVDILTNAGCVIGELLTVYAVCSNVDIEGNRANVEQSARSQHAVFSMGLGCLPEWTLGRSANW